MPQLPDYNNTTCNYCGKKFYRDDGRRNESKKYGWKSYCNQRCLSKHRVKRIYLKCSRAECSKNFHRVKSEYKKSKLHYCSHSCSALVNNAKRLKKATTIKICLFCGANFVGRGVKYCSPFCQQKGSVITRDVIIKWIRNYYFLHRHIPFKREYSHYHAARLRFGNWNNAIKAAGFEPNPVMFAKKHVANDGHKCDSLAEKIIDDWLDRRKISHLRSFPYPENLGFTVDFKVGDYWIEFFGLSGELKRYDQLKARKLKLIKRNKLKLIGIFPKDLFPKGNLDNVLKILLTK